MQVPLGLVASWLGPLRAAAAAISGYVRDAAAVRRRWARSVEILGAAARALKVFTDDRGFYSISGLLPGTYSSKSARPRFCRRCARESASVPAPS